MIKKQKEVNPTWMQASLAKELLMNRNHSTTFKSDLLELCEQTLVKALRAPGWKPEH